MIKYTVFSLYLKGLFIQNDDVRLGVSVKLQKVMEIAISVLDDEFLEEKNRYLLVFVKLHLYIITIFKMVSFLGNV